MKVSSRALQRAAARWGSAQVLGPQDRAPDKGVLLIDDFVVLRRDVLESGLAIVETRKGGCPHPSEVPKTPVLRNLAHEQGIPVVELKRPPRDSWHQEFEVLLETLPEARAALELPDPDDDD